MYPTYTITTSIEIDITLNVVLNDNSQARIYRGSYLSTTAECHYKLVKWLYMY
jgi:purine nucleoside permease